MVVAARDLELFVFREEPPDLVEGLRRNDQVTRWSSGRRDGHLHLREAMAVRGDHSHQLGAELPENAVQDRAAFLRRDREGGVIDELSQVARAHAPAVLELHRRETRKLVLGKAQDLEMRSPAVERHALLPHRGNFHWRWRQLARNLREFLCRDGDRARCVDIRTHLRADRDVEIGSGQPNSLVRRFDENVRQYGQCRLRWNRGGNRGEAFLQLLTGNRETHQRSPECGGRTESPSTALYREVSSSSSRARRHVDGRYNLMQRNQFARRRRCE